jgi:hypothetical protein
MQRRQKRGVLVTLHNTLGIRGYHKVATLTMTLKIIKARHLISHQSLRYRKAVPCGNFAKF